MCSDNNVLICAICIYRCALSIAISCPSYGCEHYLALASHSFCQSIKGTAPFICSIHPNFEIGKRHFDCLGTLIEYGENMGKPSFNQRLECGECPLFVHIQASLICNLPNQNETFISSETSKHYLFTSIVCRYIISDNAKCKE